MYLEEAAKCIFELKNVKFDDTMLNCEVCKKAKIERELSKTVRFKYEKLLKLMHTDLMELINTRSYKYRKRTTLEENIKISNTSDRLNPKVEYKALNEEDKVFSYLCDYYSDCDWFDYFKYNSKLYTEAFEFSFNTYVTVQGETDLVSEKKFLRYELLKLNVPFLQPY